MVPLAAAFAFAPVPVGVAAVMLWRLRALRREVVTLGERVQELCTRLDATDRELSRAATSADVAESLLVEKGVADEEDLEDARRRFGAQDAPPDADYVRARDDELN